MTMEKDEGEPLIVKEEKRLQHTAALSIGVICILIGLPLWWKTTEVYRFSLPYSDIAHLSDNPIEYSSEVDVIWAAGSKNEDLTLLVLAVQLNKVLDIKASNNSLLSSTYRIAVREAETTELTQLDEISTVSDLASILSTQELSKYNVIVTKPTKLLSQPYIAPNNNIFLPYNGAGASALASQIAQLVKTVIRTSAVTKSMESAKGFRAQRPDKDAMRSYRFHSGYDITFTLVVPEPDVVNAVWDIEQGVQDYLQPLLESLDGYTNFSVTSQVLYLVGLGGKPRKGDDYYYFEEQDLPHVINSLEAKLGSHATNNPGLNFIVCIPNKKKSPLYIKDNSGGLLKSNAFLSPRWGGVMIYNIDQNLKENVTTAQDKPDITVDMHEVMKVFISQIRLLLNIQAQINTKEFWISPPKDASLRQWELAGWMRCRCVENLATAISTLQSLAQLLEEIGNIVINDEIGKEVESAVSAIKSSQGLLASGDLREAFLASRAAVAASELAFFHPSLLELLYFPEDQKFAIYIPLFLPIGIPIVMSTIQAIKFFKLSRKSKAKTE